MLGREGGSYDKNWKKEEGEKIGKMRKQELDNS